MRHIISVLLENEAGALSRVARQADCIRWNEDAGRLVEWRDGHQMRRQVAQEFEFWAREIQRAGITTS